MSVAESRPPPIIPRGGGRPVWQDISNDSPQDLQHQDSGARIGSRQQYIGEQVQDKDELVEEEGNYNKEDGKSAAIKETDTIT